MMLGKRPRAPIIRRTTSMSGIPLDSDPQEHTNPQNCLPDPDPDPQPLVQDPDYNIPTPHFLRTCGLCQRALPPGRDIYMYRGDTAFCSSECREQRIKDDEKQHKLKVASKKKDPPPKASSSSSPKASSAAPETVAAA